jgi:hypothetical protein
MYEFRVNAKLRQKTGILCSILGAILFFGISYALYPIYAFYSGDPDYSASPSKSTGMQRFVDSSGNAKIKTVSSGPTKGFTMVVNRGTISTIIALFGAGLGLMMSKELAQSIQRRRDLKSLMQQGIESE